MLPLIMAACGAAGAVAGVVTTCAAKEKDKQAIKRYEKVNAELINSRDQLQQRYYELADRSKQQINELNLKLVESEMEKDLVYLALELYQELMGLREDIDINPSFEVLIEFHKAIVLTNSVLKQLDRRLVPINQDYFSRTLDRIDERDNLSKKQVFTFMAVLMNPQQDTVTSLLSEVQNEMFAQPIKELEQQNTESAIAIETEAESSVITTGNVKCPRGQKLLDLKQYENAVIYYDTATTHNPENNDLWYGLSLSLYALGRIGESLNAIDKAIEILSSEDAYWYHQSLCLSDLNMKQYALKAINKAIKLNQNNDDYKKMKQMIKKLYKR